jgi:hypothetical protein
VLEPTTDRLPFRGSSDSRDHECVDQLLDTAVGLIQSLLSSLKR